MIRAKNEIGYDGYCIDLLIEMAKILKFNFTIFEGFDGTYGTEVLLSFIFLFLKMNVLFHIRQRICTKVPLFHYVKFIFFVFPFQSSYGPSFQLLKFCLRRLNWTCASF